MAKQAKPIITQTEILNRAINSIKDEIYEWEKKGEGKPGLADGLRSLIEPLQEKLEALEQLYYYETGNHF